MNITLSINDDFKILDLGLLFLRYIIEILLYKFRIYK